MKTKKVKTIKALKTKLKKTLPSSLSKVMDSYESFLEQGVPEDAKGFNAHHLACKSAVVHVETLLKLAKWTIDDVEEKIANCEGEIDIWKIIEEAKKSESEYKDNEED